MKVILINLPVPDFYHKNQKGNHQLFSDYVQSIVRKKNIDDIEIVRIGRRAIDNYNNRALLDEILGYSPEVVGFSCYLWNIERNEAVAGELKKRGITTIAGGPEIHPESADQRSMNSFDVLISGEGEFLLLDILLQLAQKKKLERLHVTRRIVDFNYFIDEYARISEDHKFDKLAYIEIERGCPFKCEFCAYDKTRKISTIIDAEKFKKQVDHSYSLDINELYLLSPTLNRNKKNFKSYLDYIIRKKNEAGKDVRLFGELRPELISDEDIELMHDAGFDCIEFGVQSLNLRYGENLKKYDLADFAGKLAASGITPIIDFIIGFPGETSDDIMRTIDSLSDKGIIGYCNFYHLQVMHNTEIRNTFVSKGYSFQKKSPYLMLENDSIDIKGIKDIYMYLEIEKDFSYREDFFINEPEKFHVLKNSDDFSDLYATPYYHSASFIMADEFKFDEIISGYEKFFSDNPEIFHRIYLYSKNGIEPGKLRKLSDMIIPYSNYYDRYREGINYFNDELFSKTICVLLRPEFKPDYVKTMVDNYETGFVFLPDEKPSYERNKELTENYFNEEEIGTYTFMDFEITDTECIRRFPVNFR